MRVLIADDNSTFRLILSALLNKLGHGVTAVENGLHAWQTFEAEYFPVLITDWQMPELDGIQLMKRVRAKPHDHYTYVLMVASRGGKESYLEAMKAGADDFITKPPDEEQLAARLLAAERVVGVHNHALQLEAIMSVCAYCKNVKEAGAWIPMEDYVATHTGKRSSHGICPHCWHTRVKPEMKLLGIEVSDEGIV
jgi:CheY-like chemotaxis protein